MINSGAYQLSKNHITAKGLDPANVNSLWHLWTSSGKATARNVTTAICDSHCPVPLAPDVPMLGINTLTHLKRKVREDNEDDEDEYEAQRPCTLSRQNNADVVSSKQQSGAVSQWQLDAADTNSDDPSDFDGYTSTGQVYSSDDAECDPPQDPTNYDSDY